MTTTRTLRGWKILLILLSSVPVSRSEANVALLKQAVQSSDYNAEWIANKAVDNCTQTNIGSNCCTHTQVDSPKQVWWRVDLKELMTINRITIYYRGGEFKKRFAGYQLYLSNTTESPTQGVLCFEDNSSTEDQVQLLVTHQCPYVARYVTVYNYRNNIKRHSWYDVYAVLELCEVQVFGCQVGRYGNLDCNSQCSGNCYGSNCNSTTGSCFYCFPGKYGDICNNNCSTNCKDNICEKDKGYCSDCVDRKYGDVCDLNCSENCKDQSCMKDNGYCLECVNGTYGDVCDLDCSDNCKDKSCMEDSGYCLDCVDGKYGDVCDFNCSDNCKNQSCMKDNGYCLECVNGTYGDVCDFNCSDNCKDKSCMKDNGYCLECVPGKHGNMCEVDCSDNCKDKTCMKNNGNCIGCIPGKTGALCDTNCTSYCETCDQTSGQCFECVNGKYGDVCDQECPDNCKNKICMKDNGNCTECVNGKYGDVCDQDCPEGCKDKLCIKDYGNCTECVNGKYGDVCDQDCPENCKDQICMKDNGYCSDCPLGKYGLLCNNSCSETCLNNICNARSGTCEVKETTSLEPHLGNTGIIVGVIVAGLTLVITITITVLFIRRRRQNSAKQDSFDDISKKHVSRTSHHNDGYERDDYSTEPVTEQGSVYEVLDVAETEPQAGQRNVYANANNVEKMENDIKILTNNVYVNADDVDKDSSRFNHSSPATTCIAISDLKALVRTKMLNNAKVFKDEYLELPSGAIHEHNTGMLDKNRLKNRFKSTFPYDHSRVILDKLDNDSHSDYINANYIDSVISPAKYIATQGPTDKTVDDLWRMIWQLKSRKIVMLTNLVEGARNKCEKYWPDEGQPMSTKHFEIVLDRERVYAFYVIRDIILTEKKTKSVRQIHQFHYTTWPDHGTPDPSELVVFHRRVKHYNNILTGKLIVHCSAGIGRTGTFIALDALFEYGKENEVVDVMGYIRTMRKDRVNMVQTCDQYIAIHHLLIEAFDMPDTLVPRVKYHTTLQSLCDDAPVNQTKLWGDYKLIQDIKPTFTEDDYKTAKLPANRNKNRDPNVLAVDKFRAYLSSSSFGRTDYINAVEIPSYTFRKGYIVTQTPLKDTVVDLLTLIMDQDCDTLVIIEDDQVKWLPDEGSDKSIGSFKLRHEGGSSNLTNTDLIDVSISNQEQRYDARIRVFHMIGWDRQVPVPPDSPGLLQLLELLDSRRRSNDSKKTVVMCRDGYSQSGLFCCISNARDQMKMDEEVDIFQIARQLLFRRPEFITSYDQYKGCYNIIKEFLDTTDVYMN